METVKLRAHVGHDGVLKLELPTAMNNREVEVLVVMRAVMETPVDELGWPLGFFERTYGALADDPILVMNNMAE
jgi:hypothetical protein